MSQNASPSLELGPSEPLKLQPLKSGDLPGVLGILRSWEGEPFLGLESWGENSLLRELSRGESRGLFSSSGELIAFLMVRENSPGEWEVMLLAVERSWARRGLMRQLLQELKLQLSPGSKLFLEVHAGNGRAIRFYQTQGFEAVTCRQSYYPDGADALLYRFQKH